VVIVFGHEVRDAAASLAFNSFQQGKGRLSGEILLIKDVNTSNIDADVETWFDGRRWECPFDPTPAVETINSTHEY
jgi:hypothetical protein